MNEPLVVPSRAAPCLTGVPTNQTYTMRIMKDLKEFYESNIENIQVVAEEDDISVVHALIHGPESTPYANGFFYFILRFQSNYPIVPPTVRLMTTDKQRVRFNPNLYSCGKVCLSILGTWSGPAWSPVNTLLTVLLSIQSLMNEKPYHNEPGFEEEKSDKSSYTKNRVEAYNQIITHETLRVAVIGMLDENSSDARNMPQVLKDMMKNSFKNNYKYFEDLVISKLDLTDKSMNDPFFDYNRGRFVYKTLLEKLRNLKIRFDISDNQTESCESTVKPYLELAARYTKSCTNSQVETDSNDNWETIIHDMNIEDMDEQFCFDYSEESDVGVEDEGHDQKDDR